jgi:hypothetical protein
VSGLGGRVESGTDAEIDRIWTAYPHLRDDDFVEARLDAGCGEPWMSVSQNQVILATLGMTASRLMAHGSLFVASIFARSSGDKSSRSSFAIDDSGIRSGIRF